MSDRVKVTLPDGSVREVERGTTARAVAESIGAGLARAAVAARVDGAVWDLDRPIERDVSLADPDRPRPRGAGGAAPFGGARARHRGAGGLSRRRHRIRPADRGRLLLRLRGAAPVHARGSRADRGPHGPGGRRRTIPSSARWSTAERRQPAVRRRSAQARADQRAGRRRDDHGLYRRPVHRSLPRAARSRAPAV